MRDVGHLSSEVLGFALEMQRQLDENAHKGSSWRGLEPAALMKRLKQEVAELERALMSTAEPNQKLRQKFRIDNEAADVGNFAMFIASLYGTAADELR